MSIIMTSRVVRNSEFRIPRSVFRGFFPFRFRIPYSGIFKAVPHSVFRVPDFWNSFRIPYSAFRTKTVFFSSFLLPTFSENFLKNRQKIFATTLRYYDYALFNRIIFFLLFLIFFLAVFINFWHFLKKKMRKKNKLRSFVRDILFLVLISVISMPKNR